MSLFNDAKGAKSRREAETTARETAAQAEEDLRTTDPDGYVVATRLSDVVIRQTFELDSQYAFLLNPQEPAGPKVQARLQELRDQGFIAQATAVHFAGDEPGTERGTQILISLP